MDEQRECIQRPAKDIGETLYVICVTSMGLLCMCIFMEIAMMSGKKEKRNYKNPLEFGMIYASESKLCIAN